MAFQPLENTPGRGIGIKDTGVKIEPPMREIIQTAIDTQVDRLIQLHFHEHVTLPLYSDESTTVRQTETDYRKAFILPEDAIYPSEYRGRFPLLLVVDPRVDLSWQLETENIHKEPIDTRRCAAFYNYEYQQFHLRALPPRPYVVFGTRNMQLHMEKTGHIFRKNPTLDEIQKRLAGDERQGYVMELLALHREQPELLEKKFLIVAGRSTWPGLANTGYGRLRSTIGLPYIDIIRWTHGTYQKALRSYPYDWSARLINDRSVHEFRTMIVGGKIIRLGPRTERPKNTKFGTPALNNY